MARQYLNPETLSSTNGRYTQVIKSGNMVLVRTEAVIQQWRGYVALRTSLVMRSMAGAAACRDSPPVETITSERNGHVGIIGSTALSRQIR